jgi:hypothetical protein
MSSTISKILSIFLYVILGLSVIISIMFFNTNSEIGETTELGQQQVIFGNVLDYFVGWGYALLIFAVVATIGFSIYGIINNPKNAIGGLIGVILFGIVALVAYSIADDKLMPFEGYSDFFDYEIPKDKRIKAEQYDAFAKIEKADMDDLLMEYNKVKKPILLSSLPADQQAGVSAAIDQYKEAEPKIGQMESKLNRIMLKELELQKVYRLANKEEQKKLLDEIGDYQDSIAQVESEYASAKSALKSSIKAVNAERRKVIINTAKQNPEIASINSDKLVSFISQYVAKQNDHSFIKTVGAINITWMLLIVISILAVAVSEILNLFK